MALDLSGYGTKVDLSGFGSAVKPAGPDLSEGGTKVDLSGFGKPVEGAGEVPESTTEAPGSIEFPGPGSGMEAPPTMKTATQALGEDATIRGLKTGMENLYPAMKAAVGGFLRSTAEAAPRGGTGVGFDLNDPQYTEATSLARAFAASPDNPVAGVGREIYKAAREEIEANTKAGKQGIDPNSLDGYAFDIANGAVQLAPIIATSLVTKSPAIGLTGMGGQIYGEQYGAAREAGRTVEQASQDAAFYTTAQTLPYSTPLGILTREGGEFAPRILQAMGAQGLQSMFSEALQIGYEKGILDKDMTWGEAWERIKHAGIVGTVTGGTLAVATHPFTREPTLKGDILSPEEMRQRRQDEADNATYTEVGTAERGLPAPKPPEEPPPGGTPAKPFDVANASIDELAQEGQRLADEAKQNLTGETNATGEQQALGPTPPAPANEVGGRLEGDQRLPGAGGAEEHGDNGEGQSVLEPAERPAPAQAVGGPDLSDFGSLVGGRTNPVTVEEGQHMEPVRPVVNPEPSEAQKAAGNYQKGHVQVAGLNITIENPAGSERSGTAPDGSTWSVQMPADYGYVKRTEGADGDQFDVYVGPSPQSEKVWIVDQIDPKTREFDEHKGLIGFNTENEAIDAYDAGFSDGSGYKRRGAVTEMSVAEFKDYLKNGDTANALSYRKGGVPATTPEAKTETALPAGFEVDEPTPTPIQYQKTFGQGPYTAVARRLSPWSTERGYGNTPEEARQDALRRVGAFKGPDLSQHGTPVDQPAKPDLSQHGEKVERPGAVPPKAADRHAEAASWWNAMDYGKRQELAERAKVGGGGRAIIHRVSGSRWSEISEGERADLLAQADRDAAALEAPKPGPQTKAGIETGAKTDLAEVGANALAKKRNYGTLDNPDRVELGKAVAEHFASGAGFKTITEARKFIAEKLNSGPIDSKHKSAKAIDEALEVGTVMHARDVVAAGGKPSEIYAKLVDLYSRQPILGQRTSTSVEQQAYSTPAPLAYLASEFAGVTQKTNVYEPTAGNGMLLIGAKPSKISANELNPERAKVLVETLGELGAGITQKDASEHLPAAKSFDAVLTNPPFGKVYENGQPKLFDLSGRKTREVDHGIVWQALKAMKDDGRAVLIIGGKQETGEARLQAYRAFDTMSFFKKLHDAYNVVDHFTVDGKLYERQGAGWPVDVITIEGRGKSSIPGPYAEPPKVLHSWQEIGDHLNARLDAAKLGERPGVGSTAAETPEATQPGGVPERPGTAAPGSGGVRPGDRGTGAGAGAAAKGPGERGAGDQRPEASGEPAGEPEQLAPAKGGDAEPARAPERDQGQPGDEGSPGARAEGAGGPGGVSRPALPRQRVERANLEAETAHQVKYKPTSNAGYAVGTLVPKNMQAAMDRALEGLKARVGDIDDYVASKLGMKVEDAIGAEGKPGYFSAEQMDALALAIDNVENGGAFIIGDQTGVGKGRFVAAMLKYGLESGKTPVFITKDPGLYGDMIRDMRDIGMGNIHSRVLVTNYGLRGDKAIPLSGEEGDTLSSMSSAKLDKAISDIVSSGALADHDMLFTTYSQLQYGPKGLEYDRQRAVKALAGRAMFVLDESHEAGGGAPGRTQKNEAGQEIKTRADFVRELLADAPGVIYSSATYAKNPNVMSLYFKTDLALAVDDIKQLAAVISSGGVPMQQIVANMLVEGGQYARRERSFEGVKMDMSVLPTSEKTAETAAATMREIFALDLEHMEAVRKSFIEEMGNEGIAGGKDSAVGEKSASQTGFSSIMHNVISQSLLALKAPAVVERALALAKEGKKPIIAVSNTNESILSDYVDDIGAKLGDKVTVPFNAILERYLARLRRITLKDENKNISYHTLTDADIEAHGGPEALAAYKAAEKAIRSADLSELPANPIDYILDKLNAAGVKADEITGRGMMVKNGVLTSRKASPAEKKRVMNAYNGGSLDALVINKSGSTGYSMHATALKGNDGKQRHMLILQADPNIDTFMQMLGRIHRTGQIKLPEYTIGVSDLAIEKRPAAVLMKKMASLNANTTASKKSAVSLDSATDIMNKYGDEVVNDYLKDHPDLSVMLDVRPRSGEMPLEGIAAKLTGRLAIIEPKGVAQIYEDIESAYREHIEALDRMGLNTLEAKTLDLQAKTEKSDVLVPEKEGNSPFAEAASVETVSVKKLGKPYSLDELKAELSKATEGKPPRQFAKGQAEHIEGLEPVYLKEIQGRLEAAEKAMAELPETATEKQQEKALDRIEGWRNTVADAQRRIDEIKQRIEEYAPGRTMTLTAIEGEAVNSFHAVSLGASLKGLKDNPTAASQIKIRFAVADAAREISIPLSKMLGAEPPFRASPTEQSEVMQAFEEGRSEGREKRQIITGNLVSGFAQFKKGQFVMFTDADGKIRQGILMPKEFDAAKEMAKKPVAFDNPKHVTQFLRGGKNTRMVESADGVVGITKSGSGFDITVNTRGGKPYYLNKEARDAVGDFIQRKGAKVFRAHASDAPALERVLKAWQENLGEKFVTKVDKDDARALIAAGTPAEKHAIEQPSTKPSAQEQKLEAVEQKLNELAAKKFPGMPVKVEEQAKDRVAAKLTNRPGLGRVAMLSLRSASGRIRSPEELAELLGHEGLHYLIEQGAIGKLDMRILSRAVDSEGWRDAFKIDQRYKTDSEEAKTEEAIVHGFGDWWINGTKIANGVRAIFQRLKSFFERFGNWLDDNGWRNHEDIFRELKAGKYRGGGDKAAARMWRGLVDQGGPMSLSEAFMRSGEKHAIERPERPANAGTPKPKFDNPETEKRWTEARGGIASPETLIQKTKAWLSYVGHGFTRHYIELPNNARFADVHEQLRKLEAAPEAARQKSIRQISSLTRGMTSEDLDLFTRKVVMDDLAHEASEDHDLPFGMTPDDVDSELAKLDATLRTRPDLAAALAERKIYAKDMADDAVDAGVLSEAQIKNPAYYRHQVIDYARANAMAARQGGRLRTPHWASRHGSVMDINANLLEAEFDWMNRMYLNIDQARTIDWIKDSEHNIRGDILSQAREFNKARSQEIIDAEGPTGPLHDRAKHYSQRIAMGMSMVKRVIDDGSLHIPEEWERAADSLAGNATPTDDGEVFRFLSWILDNDEAGSAGAGTAMKAISDRRQWTRELLGKEYADHHNMESLTKRFAPEGYVTWQPDEGRYMFNAKTLPEHVIDGLMQMVAEGKDWPVSTTQLRDALSDVRSMLAVGGNKYEMVIPQELALTLNSLKDVHADSLFEALLTKPLSAWKMWTLLNPHHYNRYQLNNMSGELDSALASAPKMLKKLPQAVSELWHVLRGGEPTQNYLDAEARGIFMSGLTIQEIPDINGMPEFKGVTERPGLSQPAQFTAEQAMKVWRFAKTSTTFRENWIRYAAYLHYLEEVESGKPQAEIGYGASIPEAIDAIEDPKDKAGVLARDAIADYAGISHWGKGIRRKAYPFWSWLELNTRRYWRLGANAWSQGLGKGLKATAHIGLSAGVKGVAFGAGQTTRLAFRMMALYGLVQLWNNLVHGDLEDELDPADKARLHLTLGKNSATGEIYRLRFQGSLSDVMAWFGFEDVAMAMHEIDAGRGSYADVLSAMAKAPVKRLAQGITPVITVPWEMLTRQSLFPDPFRPMPIRDPWQHLFQTFSLENEYNAIADKPSRGYARSLAGSALYTLDPGENAYGRTQTLAHQWLAREKGGEGSSSYTTPTATALHDLKLAQKFGDEAAETKARDTLDELGVTGDKLRQSIQRAHPLAAIPIKDRAAFKSSLTDRELSTLDQAIDWYRDTYHP